MKNVTLKAAATTLVLLTALTGTANAQTSSTTTEVLNTQETQDYIEIIKQEAASQGYNIDFGNHLPKVTMTLEFMDVPANETAVDVNQISDAEMAAIEAEFNQSTDYQVNYLNGIGNASGSLSNYDKQQVLNAIVQSFQQDGVTIDFQGHMPNVERN